MTFDQGEQYWQLLKVLLSLYLITYFEYIN